MENARLARWWLQFAGVVLVVVGILGFVSNPLVGPDGLVATDNAHNIVHVLTGLLALALAFGMRSDPGTACILFGALYGVVFVVTVISPSLFGIFSVPVNPIDHLIHIGLAVVSIALGWMARTRPMAVAR
jgi:uncharacterized membrane protein HdeD (DUF308 family)